MWSLLAKSETSKSWGRQMAQGQAARYRAIASLCCQFSPLSPPLSHSLAVFRTVISAFVCLITCLLCQTQWAIWQPWWWPSVLLGWGSFPITYLAFSSRDSRLKGVRCFRFLGFLPLTRWVSHLGPGFEVEASSGDFASLEVCFSFPEHWHFLGCAH